METVTISAKIPKDLKRRLERHRIKVSKVVREALEEEVVRVEEEMLKKTMREVGALLKRRLSEEDIVKAVRESRDER